MRVQFGDIWLAGDPDESIRQFSETADFETQPDFVEQVAPKFRAASPDLLYRGNALQLVRFKVTREFASVEDSQDFALTHVGALVAAMEAAKPLGLDATFTKADDSLRVMARSLCRSNVVGVIGVSLVIQYELKGQPITGASIAATDMILIRSNTSVVFAAGEFSKTVALAAITADDWIDTFRTAPGQDVDYYEIAAGVGFTIYLKGPAPVGGQTVQAVVEYSL